MSEREHKIPYRADIDGLRGVAVIVVVLFHAKVFGFSGGFVGVDIFFVISGYLITSLIVADLHKGTFSYKNFLANRMRRILPALFIVLTGVSVLAYIFLTFPGDLHDFGKTLTAQSLFFSNMFFMVQDTYFSAHLETNALLHTWSLSIEEQFYFLFPALMLLIASCSRRKSAIILALVGALSLTASIYLINIAPSGNALSALSAVSPFGTDNSLIGFFSLPTRAWELLAGAVVAVTAYTLPNTKMAMAFGIAGIGLIVCSILFIDTNTPFPGIASILPVAAAILIIWSGVNQTHLISNLLSWKPLVSIGLISYPLYLWHWPLLTFAFTYKPSLNAVGVVLVLIASLVLSYLTYFYIERPVRLKKLFPSANGILLAGLISVSLLAAVGHMLGKMDSHYAFPEEMYRLGILEDKASYEKGDCMQTLVKNISGLRSSGPCFLGVQESGTPPTMLLWGDSHAGSLAPVIDVLAREHGVKVAMIASNTCIPFFNLPPYAKYSDCALINAYAKKYAHDNNIDKLILSANWQIWYSYPAKWGGSSVNKVQTNFEDRLFDAEIARSYSTSTIYVINQIPQQTNFSVRTLFYTTGGRISSALPEPVSYEKHLDESDMMYHELGKVSTDENYTIIDPAKALCEQDSTCKIEHEGTLVYRDYSHLNEYGAMLLAPLFEEIFND